MMKLKFIYGLIVFAVISCSATVVKPEKVYFDTKIVDDATPAVVARLLQANEKPISEISFEKGIYHFYPDKGFEKFCYISNHGDLMVKTPFPIFGLKDLTINGNGSTFIFHGVIIPFMIDNSTNVTVKNLSIDWNEPFHSEGLIVANDEENKTFDMKISEDYPYDIRNGQIYFVKEYYEHDLGQSILYDVDRKAIAFDTEAYTNITTHSRTSTKYKTDRIKYKYEVDKKDIVIRNVGVESRIKVEQLKPGLVRVYGHRKKLPPVGTILTMKGGQGYNRISPAFRVTHTNGFNAKDVNVHHAGGMGIIAENSADIILDSFNVTPSNGRMVSTTADATHFVGCRGKVVLKNSTFENQLDDASNVHGTYQIIVDVLDKHRIGVRMGHHQQQGFSIGRINDNIGFVRLSDSFYPYEKGTIKNIQYLNSRYQIITFNEELPKDVKKGDLIENLDAYPEFIVENCQIKNNRARGLLLSTPKKTIIKDNYFSTEMEGILIPVESSSWYESGSVNNLIITGNTFEDCQHSGFDRGVIRFDTDDDNENTAFRNIEISNNKFNHFDNWVLQVTNADGLMIKNNTITNSGNFKMLHPKNAAIQIKHSKNVKLESNSYKGKAAKILETDESLPNLKFE